MAYRTIKVAGQGSSGIERPFVDDAGKTVKAISMRVEISNGSGQSSNLMLRPFGFVFDFRVLKDLTSVLLPGGSTGVLTFCESGSCDFELEYQY